MDAFTRAILGRRCGMNEELMFEELRKLTWNCGIEIDRIAKETNINQWYITDLFMNIMQSIFDKMREGESDERNN